MLVPVPRPLLLLLLSCAGPCADEPAGPPSAIVVVLDGARLDETLGTGESSVAGTPTAEVMPQLSADLAAEGAIVRPGHAVGITLTAPGHCDLLTGRRQVFANYALTDEGVAAYRPVLPTLFEAVRAQGGSARDAALIVNTTLLEPLDRSLYPGAGALQNGLVVAVTETVTDEDIAALEAALKEVVR